MRITVTSINRCRGITLVELLLTLAALMFVASLGWKAASTAITVANNSRVTLELVRFSEALEAFFMQFGEYPPDFHDSMAVRKFLKQRFPKCPETNYPVLTSYSPASALCFWLGGPNGRGFSANPVNPFDNGPRRIGPFFRFTPDQLKRVDGVTQYYPPRGIDGAPYVYFRGSAKGYDGHPGWSMVRPYRDATDGSWINPDSYQILSPGHDGKFGNGNRYPCGADCDDATRDDMANFTRGGTMQQEKPVKPKPGHRESNQ